MRIVAPLKELCSNSREQCVGEDILFALCSVADLCSVLLKLRLDEVGRTAGDDLVIADALLADFLVTVTCGSLSPVIAETICAICAESALV